MKKWFFSVILLMASCVVLNSCIKNKGSITTITPYMVATIGTYTFNAATVVPSTLDTQAHDTTTTLYITAHSSDLVYPKDKIILTITKYKGLTGTFSIVQGLASATYTHEGISETAAFGIISTGGQVSITQITSNSIIGYFNFNTPNVTVSNGSFNIGKP